MSRSSIRQVLGLGFVLLASVLGRVLADQSPGWVFTCLVAMWAAGIALAATRWINEESIRAVRARPFPRSTFVDVVALFVAGLAWRMLAIGHLPANYLGDEMSQAAEAWRFATGQLTNPFMASDWYGVPHLYMWIGGWLMWAFGPGAVVWRGFTAVAGALAVPILYLAVRVQLGSEGGLGAERRAWSSHLAILAGLALCFQHLSLYFSRLGSNQGFDPLFQAAILLCLALGVRGKGNGAWFAAGVVAGLGFYFYFALRGVATLTALFILVIAVLDSGSVRGAWDRRRLISVLTPLGWYLFGLLLAVLPLYAALAGTDKLAGRMLQVLAPSVAETRKDVWADVLNRLTVMIQSIQGRGLKGWYESGAGILVSRLELVVVAVGAARALRMPRHSWLYVAYPLGIVAAVALFTENPVASQRVTASAVGVAALTAFGADHLGRLVWPKKRAVVGTALVGVIAAASVAHLFLGFLPRRDVDITALVATEIIHEIQRSPEIREVMFCGGDKMDWRSNAALPYFLPQITVVDLTEDWDAGAKSVPPAAVVITAPTCPRLRNRLLHDPDLEGRQLLFRTGLSLTEALRMTLGTGGLGWMRWATVRGSNIAMEGNEVEVFTLFRPHYGGDNDGGDDDSGDEPDSAPQEPGAAGGVR